MGGKAFGRTLSVFLLSVFSILPEKIKCNEVLRGLRRFAWAKAHKNDANKCAVFGIGLAESC